MWSTVHIICNVIIIMSNRYKLHNPSQKAQQYWWCSQVHKPYYAHAKLTVNTYMQSVWGTSTLEYHLNLLWSVSTTMMVVKSVDIEPSTSTQCIIVPFKLLVPLIIVNVETKDKAPWVETLVKLNKVKFTVLFDVWAPKSSEFIFLSMFLSHSL